MSIKNRLQSLIRGWLPKEPNMTKNELTAESKVSKPMPWWWRPLWVISILVTIVSGVVTYFVLDTTVLRAFLGLGLCLLGIGIAYYIRIRPSVTINRAVYVLIGITPIGLIMWFVSSFVFNRVIITAASGSSALFYVSGAVCLSVGALIGDRIGKRRGYILPMSP